MPKINEEVMRQFMNLTGDIAELGVNHGSSSKIMIPIAEEFNKVIWLFNSFRGMPSSHEPTDLVQYPEGRFDLASADAIIKRHNYKQLRVIAGWLPDSLKSIKVRYCFVFLDLDHYEGTLATLNEVWKRIIVGGGILCDDYIAGRRPAILAGAIDEFIKDQKDLDAKIIGNQMLLIKK